jgi:ferredoxin
MGQFMRDEASREPSRMPKDTGGPVMGEWLLELDRTLCTGCGLCAQACPCGAVLMGPEGPVFRCRETCPHDADCVAIVHAFHPCESTCPAGAIALSFEIVVLPEDASPSDAGPP